MNDFNKIEQSAYSLMIEGLEFVMRMKSSNYDLWMSDSGRISKIHRVSGNIIHLQ